jgi:ribosomal protein L30
MTYVKVTQVKSVIGRIEPQKRTARALGLRKINDSTVVPDNEAVRGMIRAIAHLVEVEPAEAPKNRVKKAPKVAAPKAEAKGATAVTEATAESKTEAKPAVEKKPAAAKPAAAKAPAAKKPAVKKPATAKAPAAKKPAATKKTTTPKKESK